MSLNIKRSLLSLRKNIGNSRYLKNSQILARNLGPKNMSSRDNLSQDISLKTDLNKFQNIHRRSQSTGRFPQSKAELINIENIVRSHNNSLVVQLPNFKKTNDKFETKPPIMNYKDTNNSKIKQALLYNQKAKRFLINHFNDTLEDKNLLVLEKIKDWN